MKNNFPNKNKLIQFFLSCTSWEEKYIYIIDLGKILSKFPNNLDMQKYLIYGCQSQTWIAVIASPSRKNEIIFHGYSDSVIVRGIIVIIFSLYQGLNAQEIITLDIKAILNQLELHQNLSISRSQGIYFMINAIHIQSNILLSNQK